MERQNLRRRRSVIRILWILIMVIWVLTALAQLGEAIIRVLKALRD